MPQTQPDFTQYPISHLIRIIDQKEDYRADILSSVEAELAKRNPSQEEIDQIRMLAQQAEQRVNQEEDVFASLRDKAQSFFKLILPIQTDPRTAKDRFWLVGLFFGCLFLMQWYSYGPFWYYMIFGSGPVVWDWDWSMTTSVISLLTLSTGTVLYLSRKAIAWYSLTFWLIFHLANLLWMLPASVRLFFLSPELEENIFFQTVHTFSFMSLLGGLLIGSLVIWQMNKQYFQEIFQVKNHQSVQRYQLIWAGFVLFSTWLADPTL